MDTEPPQLPIRLAKSWLERHPLLIRFFLVGLLTAFLGIPLLAIHFVIAERVTFAAVAEDSIRATWGASQTFVGPMLEVPYSYTVQTQEWLGNADQRQLQTRTRTAEGMLYLFPDQLELHAKLDPSERTRGLFHTWVYRGDVRVTGRFASNALDQVLLPDGGVPHWDRANLIVLAKDLRGVDRPVTLDGGMAFAAATTLFDGFQGMQTPWRDSDRTEFAFSMPLQGSGAFEVAPLGRSTNVTIESSWADPSFYGLILPAEREVSVHGFRAVWRFSEFTHALPKYFVGSNTEPYPPLARIAGSAVGVRLDRAVGPQRMAERAVKYGFLFIIFILGLFYAMDAVGPSELRVAHYFWVGLAACLFFLLLLAVSEVLPFPVAYGLASSASLVLINVFTRNLLGTSARSLVLLIGLGAIFGYLYVVLQMEDYALLAGSLALFVALAVAMRLTRQLVR